MSNRTVYLRVAIVEEIPTRKREETLEETVDGFEIEFTDLRDARKALLKASDTLEGLEQFDIMDAGEDDEDDDEDEDQADDDRQLMANVANVVKKHIRRKLR